MKQYVVFLLVLFVVVISCQKEASFNRVQDSDGELLIRAEQVGSSGDSGTAVFEYDANKRLIKSTSKGYVGGSLTGTEIETITRNASGMITKIRYEAADAADSYTIYAYSNSDKYTYSVREDEDGTGAVYKTDSSVYEYNSSGKIVRQKEYDYDTGDELSLIDYQYDVSGNVSKYFYYTTYGGSQDLIETVEFTYDNKTNPLIFGNESMIRQDYGWSACVNNQLSIKSFDEFGGLQIGFNYTYTYNLSNKPATATVADNWGYSGIARFFYQ